jgi:hypothetical protein
LSRSIFTVWTSVTEDAAFAGIGIAPAGPAVLTAMALLKPIAIHDNIRVFILSLH